jgi:molybdopterin-containing oxidoreductase family membrane subunit
MLELAVKGNKKYFGWITALLVLVGIGFGTYLHQLGFGLGITGMSRDVSWGFYIAQFTFLVGVAAGGVMVVLPYYLHNYKAFAKVTILGEFLAIAAITMCLLFILVDLGQPMRMFNVILYPTPNSVLFWDMIVLNGYLFLNIVIGWNVLEAERNNVHYPMWLKPLIYISIPWAVGIHTVTAYLYCGLPGRGFWLTAILAPRFLASAFAAGPALLMIIALILRRNTKFDVGQEAQNKLVTIIGYAAMINFFFLGCEFFVAYYSQLPGHMHTLDYLFWGLGHGDEMYNNLVPFMRASVVMGLAGIALLFVSRSRKSDAMLALSCALIFISFWIDKGLGLVLGGFVPSPLEYVTEYTPSIQELGITAAIWATGFFVLTILYKVAISVKLENEA